MNLFYFQISYWFYKSSFMFYSFIIQSSFVKSIYCWKFGRSITLLKLKFRPLILLLSKNQNSNKKVCFLFKNFDFCFHQIEFQSIILYLRFTYLFHGRYYLKLIFNKRKKKKDGDWSRKRYLTDIFESYYHKETIIQWDNNKLCFK